MPDVRCGEPCRQSRMKNSESPFFVPEGNSNSYLSRELRPAALFFVYATVVFFLWMGFVPLATSGLQTIWPPQASDLFRELLLFLSAYVPALGLARIEGGSIADGGLPLRALCWPAFCKGCVIGLAEVSLLIALIAAGGGYSFGTITLDGTALFEWAAYWAAFFLFVGLAEEFAFRGYSQAALARLIGFWPAAIVLSIAFGAIHLTNQGENPIGIAGIVGTGMVLALTLRRTGNLWIAVGWHAAFDFGETFLYSVPDSGTVLPGHLSNASLHGPVWLTGGTAGPEGSVFSFVTMAAAAFFVHKAFPAAKPTEPATIPVTGSAGGS
jgi:membrane protease YdiL (CAAX protease family)